MLCIRIYDTCSTGTPCIQQRTDTVGKEKQKKKYPAQIQLDYMKKLSFQINARHEFYSVIIGALLVL